LEQSRDVIAGLCEIFRAEWPAQVPKEGLGAATKIFYEGVGLDSIDGVTLLVAVEEKFEITIERDEVPMSAFDSIGTLASYVEAVRSVPLDG
jgi:acyl carrier protein